MDKVALQFSGGKDSTAALYLLKEDWPEMTVYWLNSGDAFPETIAFVRRVAQELPHFVEVAGDVHQAIAESGIPADIIPFDASDFAKTAMLPEIARLQNRGMCCFRSKMQPLMARMISDGITTIIRGQKLADRYKSPIRSHQVAAGFRFLFPIETWTDDQVHEYLDKIDRMPPLYESGVLRSGDCMTCSAWLGDNRPNYLRAHHPEKAAILAQRLAIVAQATRPSLINLATAIGDLNGKSS